jgi:hypothetical protein
LGTAGAVGWVGKTEGQKIMDRTIGPQYEAAKKRMIGEAGQKYNLSPEAIDAAVNGDTKPVMDELTKRHLQGVAQPYGISPKSVDQAVGGNADPAMQEFIQAKLKMSPENAQALMSMATGKTPMPLGLTPDKLMTHMQSIQNGDYWSPIKDVASGWWNDPANASKRWPLALGAGAVGLGALGQLTGATPSWMNALAAGGGAAGMGYGSGAFDKLLGKGQDGPDPAEGTPPQIAPALSADALRQLQLSGTPGGETVAAGGSRTNLEDLIRYRNEWQAQQGQPGPPSPAIQ